MQVQVGRGGENGESILKQWPCSPKRRRFNGFWWWCTGTKSKLNSN